MNWYRYRESWSFILRRYLPCLVVYSLVWEIVQLPLYTLWADPSPGRIAFAVAHCTVGDTMIGTAALLIALTISHAGEPANWPRLKILLRMILIGLAYTLVSERVNLTQGNWAYSTWMPVVPGIEVGLSPLLQWVVGPPLAWWWANRRSPIR
jgi:hypothetical protein